LKVPAYIGAGALHAAVQAGPSAAESLLKYLVRLFNLMAKAMPERT